jgi:hypothetical protein
VRITNVLMTICKTILGMHMWEWIAQHQSHAVVIDVYRCKLSSNIKPDLMG